MTKLVTVLAEDFADWETTMLSGAGRAFYGFETHYASPGGREVTSLGNLRVRPDMALEDVDADALDVLVICGGNAWQRADAPDISSLVHATHDRGKIVAGICDGTFALARSGLLDTIAHTSNGVGYLDKSGYRGKALYRDVPGAVGADRVITASATASVGFTAAVLAVIGMPEDRVKEFLAMQKAQYGQDA